MKRMMQINRALLFTGLTALSAPTFAQVAPVPPLMNFQGRLAKPDGTPVPDGMYTVNLSLWDVASGGAAVTDQLWTETETVAVHNGVFSAVLGKTTALTDSLFNNAVWLEIQVAADPALAPRQQLLTVAHAFKADVALSVPAASITDANIVSVDFSKITNFPTGTGGGWNLTGNAGLDPAVNFLGTTDLIPLIFQTNGKRAMRYDYAENTYTSGPLNGQTYRGVNILGGSELNAITGGAVGATIAGGGRENVGSATLPNAVSGDFGTIGGGYNNQITGYDSTISGGANNTITGVGSMIAGGAGNTVSGNYAFAAGSHANAAHTGAFVMTDSQPGTFGSFANDEMILRFQNGPGLWANYGGAGANLGVHTGTRQFGVGQTDGTATIATYVGIPSGGAADAGWLGTITNSPLHFFIGNSGPIVTLGTNGGLGVGTSNPVYRLDVNGAGNFNGGVIAHYVNIVGGSDVAEPYQVAARGKIKPLPGMVVAIDAAQIGQMRVVGKAYDKTVAGIISGANGIQPGITLRQKGTVADGEFPVASIGRVWTWCDADANGPIEAGDMLTTSKTPGHAMRVTDYNRANGSIIGKAMSPLKHGKGLVLVLVSLK